MTESREDRLSRIRAAVDDVRAIPPTDAAWLLEQIPEEWPCPNPDDPSGCYCPGDGHLEGAS